MASIELLNSTRTSLEVRIIDAQSSQDGSWVHGDRLVTWFVDGKLCATNNLPGDATASDTVNIDGLKSGISYTIMAKIFRQDTGDLIATLSEEFETTSWVLANHDLGLISDRFTQMYINYRYITRRWAVTFSNSGEFKVHIESTYTEYYEEENLIVIPQRDMVVWITTSPKWDNESGCPTSGILVDSEADGSVGPNTTLSCNVEEGTTYYIWAKSYFAEEESVCFNLTITPPEKPAVTAWSWDTSNGSATVMQTSDAYIAVTNKGYTSDFSYKVWNDLVDKVKDVADYGDGWYTTTYNGDTTYLSYDDTLMTSDDKNITAARFNALKFNIGSRNGSKYTDSSGNIQSGTGISDVSRGDVIYGWYFTRLTESLNNVIKSL